MLRSSSRGKGRIDFAGDSKAIFKVDCSRKISLKPLVSRHLYSRCVGGVKGNRDGEETEGMSNVKTVSRLLGDTEANQC